MQSLQPLPSSPPPASLALASPTALSPEAAAIVAVLSAHLEVLQRIYGELCAQRFERGDQILDCEEAAALLKCSVRHLRDLVGTRSIPFFYDGRIPKFIRKDLIDHQRGQSHYPTAAGRKGRSR